MRHIPKIPSQTQLIYSTMTFCYDKISHFNLTDFFVSKIFGYKMICFMFLQHKWYFFITTKRTVSKHDIDLLLFLWQQHASIIKV